jgi:O-phosphoseryl-tRNA(Cys) synthetase
MWDLWCRKWRWGSYFPNTSVSHADFYSTDCSTHILVYHPRLVQKKIQVEKNHTELLAFGLSIVRFSCE